MFIGPGKSKAGQLNPFCTQKHGEDVEPQRIRDLKSTKERRQISPKE